MLDNLNEKQFEAATSRSKYIRVIAGAGSGKTKVLTSRIVHLINDERVFPTAVLAITFTNKAALEMKNRVMDELGIMPPYISTFHSFCVKLLREDIHLLDYSNLFTIVDEDDQKAMVKDIMKSKGYDYAPKDMVSYISYNKNSGIDPEEALKLANHVEMYERKAKVYAEYNSRLEKSNCLDFDDLLLKADLLLSAFPSVLKKWQGRFKHILVDEFQDTNDIQYKLVKHLVGEDNHLFVVGDPDQTIYTWRGANVNLILNFDRDFEGAQTIILDKNYRSTSRILKASNNLISKNQKRVSKDMQAVNDEGEDISVVFFNRMDKEAEWVIDKISSLRYYGTDYKDVAILYRANYLSRPLEMALLQAHIPYKIYGGIRFFERKEVKDAMCYLRLLVNTSDDLAFLRIINAPKRGIGETTLENIKNCAESLDMPLCEFLRNNREVIKTNKEKVNIALNNLYNSLDKAKEEPSFPIALRTLLENVGYFNMLEDDENKEERVQNINELLNSLMIFQNNNPKATLDEYVQEIALYSAQDEMEEGDFVNLMTVHTAKGLEFDNVFIYAMNDGVFPSSRAMEESEDGLEEERRIAYVAMTRAKKKLFITTDSDYSFAASSNGTPSRFIFEMGIAQAKQQTRPTRFGENKVIKKPINVVKYNSQAKSSVTWKVTDKVFHETFGEGVVVNVEDEIILTIVFKNPEYGKKTIMGNHPLLRRI